jgi:hypothetical protein
MCKVVFVKKGKGVCQSITLSPAFVLASAPKAARQQIGIFAVILFAVMPFKK